MKKNKMMRLASAMLVLTLLSSSVISGTFAKYAATGTGYDFARVAKWGVVITAGGSLYGTKYTAGELSASTPTADSTSISVAYDAGNTTQTVNDNGDPAAAVTDLVAPGTASSSTGLSFSITGQPEVKTQVAAVLTGQDIYLAPGTYAVMQKATVTPATFADKKTSGLYTCSDSAYAKVTGDYDATVSAGAGYFELTDQVTVGENGYYPITYQSGNSDVSGTKITEIAQNIAAKIAADVKDSDTSTAKASYSATNTYAPNTDLAKTLKLNSNTITWQWVFEDSADSDKEDTILSELMAGGTTVVKVDGSGDSVAALAVDSTGLVTEGEGESKTEVGSVRTFFDISITATQVD